MKAQLKPRPQSKTMRRESRPASRYLNPEQAKITFQQAKQQQGHNLYQKAIELYLRATIYDPNYFQAFCNIGSCYRTLGQYMQARRYLKRAISIKNDDAISHYNLANVERLIGDLEPAIDHYNFVINLKEEKGKDIGTLYINSLINIGICYKNNELYQKANQCYQKALKIDPKEESALFNYGMSVASSLRKINAEVFQEVVKQKAEKATQIFKRLLQVSKSNTMAELQIIHMSCIIDQSGQNINKAIQKLKKLLKTPNCTLTDQINSQLGYCLGLAKKFEQSAAHYQKSLSKFNQTKKSQTGTNIYDNPDGFTDKPMIKNHKFITEDQGIKMIEEGLIQEVRDQIQRLKDTDQAKYVLQLALELRLSEINQSNLNAAVNVYNNHFKKKNGQIAMDRISIEGHKAIGKLLALQKNYKQSIKHFQYISSKINSEPQKSKVHSSLATDYQAMGDRTKALEQYKLALKTQPDDYQLVYNVGCFFHDENAYSEAITYFQKFLELIQRNASIEVVKKTLYIADCLVTMTACKSQLQVNKQNLYPLYEKAWQAVKEVQSQTSQTQYEFQDEKLLSFYLQWADILQQKLAGSMDKHTQQFISAKQKLLQVYMSLLQIKSCPDRDAILSNCATIYYEQKLYVNSLANFNQIANDRTLSKNTLALIYLHLREHYMATKNVFKAAEEDSDDNIEQFNKSVIAWIFGIQKDGYLSQKFKNNSDDALNSRLEYAILLIDAITTRINHLPEHYQLQQIQDIVNAALNSPYLAQYYEQTEHAKLKLITKILSQNKPASNDYADPNFVALCLTESLDPQHQFTSLLKKLQNQGDQLSQSTAQTLINLFIFINQVHTKTLRTVLHKYYKQPNDAITLNLDRRVTITPDLTTRIFGDEYVISKVDDMVTHLVNWESELQSKIVVVIRTIQKYYYKSNVRRPMEIEYHFPRHAEWDQCTSTLLKIAFVLMQGFKIQRDFVPKGKQLNDMKYRVFAQLQQELIKKVGGKGEVKVTLGGKFVPVTIYTYHQTKKDCLQFLKDLQKESSDKHEIQIGKDAKEIVIDVSSILRLKCQWQQPSNFINTVKSFFQCSLPIEIQALLGLQSELYALKESSQKNRQLIEEYQLFRQ